MPFESLWLETKANEHYIESLDEVERLVVMTECRWKDKVRTNAEIRQFVDSRFKRKLDGRNYLSEEEIVRAMLLEKFFGIVECDLSVPDILREHFSKFCPIFKNTLVSRKDIGETMREFAEKNNIMNQPRRTLIGKHRLHI